jgi:putative cardiolipin synthase
VASDQKLITRIAFCVCLLFTESGLATQWLQPARPLPRTAFASTQENQRMTLLTSGLSSMRKRLQLIESATRSIETEFYIYTNDQVGRLYTQALVRKARAGVRVRILVDDHQDNPNLNSFDAVFLAQNGVELRFYNDTSLLKNFMKANHRLHRKSLIVDGQGAVLGGRNMADDFFEFHKEYNMLDTDIAVEGSLVGPIKESFEAFWNSPMTIRPEKVREPSLADFGLRSETVIPYDVTSAGKIQKYRQARRDYFAKLALSKQLITPSAEDLKALDRVIKFGDVLLQNEVSGICNESYYFADLPGNTRASRVVYKQVAAYLSTATKSMVIESPFCIKTETDSMFEKATARKVQVDIVTNSLFSADVFLSIAPFFSYAKELSASGVQIYMYRGDSPRWQATGNPSGHQTRWGTHAKTVILDDDSILVGSFNMDPRSAALNAEMAVACRNNPQLANGLTTVIEQRKSTTVKLNENGDPVDGSTLFTRVDLNHQLGYYISKPFAHLFDFLM